MAKTKQDGFPFSAIPRGKDLSLLWLACALAVIGIAPARAQTTEIVLHNFAPPPPHGSFPFAGVIRDSAGNLYGTTNHGGAANAGVVYKVDTAGHQTVLYSFGGGADGSYPSGVIGDSARNFYGTTYEGGTPGGGTVYELDAAGHKTVLTTSRPEPADRDRRLALSATRPATFTGPLAYAAPRNLAWCTNWMRRAIIRCCTGSPAGPTGGGPPQGGCAIWQATSTGRPPAAHGGV